MSNKSKTVQSTTPKTNKCRPSTVGAASSSRHVPSTVPEFDAVNRQIAYGKLLRSMLEDCLLDEKIEREETQIDKDLSLLANRFQKTMSQLDLTNSRLKEISSVAERERLLELRRQDNAHIFETTEKSDVKDILTNLSANAAAKQANLDKLLELRRQDNAHIFETTEKSDVKDILTNLSANAAAKQANLDKLTIETIDFGYDINNGYKQLAEAVSDAIEGLHDIRKHSNLDMSKCKEFARSKTLLKQMELSKMDLDTLKKEYDAKFPMVGEKLLQEASEKFAKMIDDDDD